MTDNKWGKMEKFKIFVENENICIDLQPGEHIVKAMGKVNHEHDMNGCCGGGCGICRIRVLEGEFTTKKMSARQVSEEDKQNGYYLGCRVFPTSDMRIEYVGLKK